MFMVPLWSGLGKGQKGVRSYVIKLGSTEFSHPSQTLNERLIRPTGGYNGLTLLNGHRDAKKKIHNTIPIEQG